MKTASKQKKGSQWVKNLMCAGVVWCASTIAVAQPRAEQDIGTNIQPVPYIPDVVVVQPGSEQDKGFWDTAKGSLTKITEEGKWDVYLSGYAQHYNRPKTRRHVNEEIWGGGLGKTYRNAKGNDESLFVMANQDSTRHVQVMAGYGYQWMYTGSSGLEAGAGYSVFLMSRHDTFDRFPFPVILPTASIGTKQVKLMATFVPFKLGEGNNGTQVLYIFGKITFD